MPDTVRLADARLTLELHPNWDLVIGTDLRVYEAYPPRFAGGIEASRRDPPWQSGPKVRLARKVVRDFQAAWADAVDLLQGGEDRRQVMADLAGGSDEFLPPDILGWLGDALLSSADERRLTLHLRNTRTDDELLGLPWERVIAWRWRQMFSDALVADTSMVRRRRGQPGAVPARLPLTLRLAGERVDPSRLFDEFVDEAIERGSFEVTGTGDPGQYEILHAVNPTEGEELERLPLRLAVLHRTESHRSAEPAEWILAGLGHASAHALLVVEEDVPTSFFRVFYRKLLHDWPIDQCVRQGLREAEGRPRAWLSLRPQAEYDVMPTTLMATRIAALQERIRGLGDRGAGERWTGEKSADEGPSPLEGLESIRPRPGPPLSAAVQRRSLRVRDDILRRAERTAAAAQVRLERRSMRRMENGIREEGHDLLDAVDVARAASEVVEDVRSVDALVDAPDHAVEDGTARSTQAWLTRGGQELGDAVPLHMGEDVEVHVKVDAFVPEGRFATPFPQEALDRLTRPDEPVELKVCFFHDEDLELSSRVKTMRLRPVGPSDEVAVVLRPLEAGTSALRIAVYYGNVLLQSLQMTAQVIEAGGAAPSPSDRPRFVLDFAATADFMLLDELEQPAASIFTNDSGNGTHWVGVYAQDLPALAQGDLHTFAAGDLETFADAERDALRAMHRGPGGKGYGYSASTSDQEVARRERVIIDLAMRGWNTFNDLFIDTPDQLEKERRESLRKHLRKESLISVNRCRGESTSLPWAALYDFRLNQGQPEKLSVCGIGREEMEKGLPSAGQCLARSNCPLQATERRESRERTVCPYGFWGLRHRIEQPIDALRDPVAARQQDEAPDEVKAAARERSQLPHPPGRVSLTLGYDPDLKDVDVHVREVQEIQGPHEGAPTLTVVPQDERDAIRDALERRPDSVFYLHCHGELADRSFRLLLKSATGPASLSAADLSDETLPENRPPFLAILGACDSVATSQDVVHRLVWALRNLGAVGVLGSEIEVARTFARTFVVALLGGMLGGQDIGGACRDARRSFMKELNPSGLLFTHYSTANLRFTEEIST